MEWIPASTERRPHPEIGRTAFCFAQPIGVDGQLMAEAPIPRDLGKKLHWGVLRRGPEPSGEQIEEAVAVVLSEHA